jgi:hypothetical protein
MNLTDWIGRLAQFRYARRWYARWECRTGRTRYAARGHLADGRFVYYKYQLATQVDRRTSSSISTTPPPQGKV